MSTMTETLVATDVETTGLSPNDGHLLLEVAVHLVSPKAPFEIIEPEGFHAVIQHDPESARALANDYVKDMHDKTGLWDRLADGTPLDEVDEKLLAYLQSHLGKREGRVFGNSIRLDMNFLDAYLPKSAGYLHYRFLDASGLAWFAHENFGVPYYEKRRTHTAEEDIQESLGELRHVTGSLARRFTRPELESIVADAVKEYIKVAEDPEYGGDAEDFVVTAILREQSKGQVS